jgi:hypothetical protein
MKTTRAAAALGLTLAFTGCGSVKVRAVPDAPQLEAKAADCDLDLLFKAPGRAYRELAELDAHVTTPGGSPEVLREKACELGADALILKRDFITNPLGHKIIAAMAIRYSDPRPAPPGSAGL